MRWSTGFLGVVVAAIFPSPSPGQTASYGARNALEDRLVVIEQQVVPAAEAMPADKYGYAPTGGAFAGSAHLPSN